MEGDVFRTIIPLYQQLSGQVEYQEKDRTEEILEFCKTERSRNEIQDFLGIKSRRYVRENIINPLIKSGLLKLTIPEKPTSSKQKYYSKKI